MVASAQLTFEAFATNITGPVDITNANDGSKRLFVVKKGGEILVFDSTGTSLGIYLNISSKIGNSGGERGLLGLAFHPNFGSNGYFFVNYTSTIGSSRTVIERYQASPSSSNSVNAAGGVEVLSFSQPFGNHNGGDLAFSPVDGYLYIPTGDGGDGNDPDERAQNLTSPHGKILRIDVSNFNDDPPYQIPGNNPFGTTKYVSEYQDTVDEIWGWGLRNPWRFCFSETGDLWIGDVGQSAREEVNFVPAAENVPGLNYGWDCREGKIACNCGNTNCSGQIYREPLYDYGFSGRQSITGGEVLEGPLYPAAQGLYLFAEYEQDNMWALEQTSNGSQRSVTVMELANPPADVSSFGKGEDGRVYVASLASNAIYRVVDQGALPIELVEVRIDRHEKTNLLGWQTGFELNASHFEIERSRENSPFEQIGIVPTRGIDSEDGSWYQFPDPVERQGHYFYRLKAVDLDGSYSYSIILDIQVGQIEQMLLTPNPATSTVEITLPSIRAAGELIVTDLSGKLLHRQKVETSELDQIELDVSTFLRGLVMIRFSTSHHDYSKKLILYR